jgi:hypothetical protein
MKSLNILLIALFLFILSGCASKEESPKTLYQNEKALYQKFGASKAESELDAEVEKLK